MTDIARCYGRATLVPGGLLPMCRTCQRRTAPILPGQVVSWIEPAAKIVAGPISAYDSAGVWKCDKLIEPETT